MRTPPIVGIIIICSSLLFSQNSKNRITIKIENENLKSSLHKISEQIGISFIYGDSLINDIAINFNFIDAEIDDALNEILNPSGLSFRKTGNNQIVIFKKRNIRRDVIAGFVMDSKTFESLPYANISIKGTRQYAIANNSGHFSLFNLPKEPHILHVQYIGYHSKDICIDTLKAYGQNLLIEMQQSAIKGDEISVHANTSMFKISENVSQFAVSPNHFSNLPIIGDKDIARSLQLMPGISAANYGSSGLIIRGGKPSQNLIMLDGIKLYHINHLFGFFSSFNPDAIKDTRIIKGGHPAKYGDRLSGVIEVTARNGDINRPRLNLSLSQVISGAVMELPLFGKGSILLSARKSYSDFVFGSLYDRLQKTLYSNKVDETNEEQSSFGSNNNSNLYFYDLLGKMTLFPTKSDIFTLSYFKAFDHLDSKEISDILLTDKKTKSEWGNNGISFKWYKQWTKGFNSNTTIAYSDYFTHYSMFDNSYLNYYREVYNVGLVTESNVQNNLDDLSFQNQNHWQINKDHLLEFGLSFTNAKIDFSIVNEYLDFDSLNSIDFLGEEELEKSKLYSFYFQDSWQAFKKLKITPGLRINKYNHSANPDWGPRLSMRYLLTPEISFNSAWGKYYQYILQYGDGNQVLDGRTSWILANGDKVKTATSDHLIIGSNYETDDYLFNLEGYYKSSNNIPDAHNEWQYLQTNKLLGQLDDEAYGLDILFQKKRGSNSGWLAYSLAKSTSEVTNSRKKIQFPANHDIRHKINIVINKQIKNWHLSLSWMYSSGRPSTTLVVQKRAVNDYLDLNYLADSQPRNQDRLPDTHQLDVSVNYNFDFMYVDGAAGISIFDFYNRQNVWYRDYVINEGNLQVVETSMFGFTPTFFLQLKF